MASDSAVAIVLPDAEEKDQLQRNNKKVKVGAIDGDTVTGDRHKKEGVLSPDNTDQSQKVSFRDAITNNLIPPTSSPQETEELDVSDEELDDEEEDSECPKVRVSVEERRRLRKVWMSPYNQAYGSYRRVQFSGSETLHHVEDQINDGCHRCC